MARVNTKTGLANLAISLNKGSPVTSIDPPDKNSRTAKVAAEWYEDTRREVLSQTIWDFAIKRASISASSAPEFGWSAKYQLPSDFIRIATIGDEKNPLTSEDYCIEDGFILCNEAAPLQLRYVYDAQDISKYSPQFVMSFAKKLAGYIAAALTGSLNQATTLNELAEMDISTAKTLDAQQTPPTKVSRSRWKTAKYIGHTDRD